jgi:hypothetical protein
MMVSIVRFWISRSRRDLADLADRFETSRLGMIIVMRMKDDQSHAAT